jgi:hypothetical protein
MHNMTLTSIMVFVDPGDRSGTKVPGFIRRQPVRRRLWWICWPSNSPTDRTRYTRPWYASHRYNTSWYLALELHRVPPRNQKCVHLVGNVDGRILANIQNDRSVFWPRSASDQLGNVSVTYLVAFNASYFFDRLDRLPILYVLASFVEKVCCSRAPHFKVQWRTYGALRTTVVYG